MTSTTRFEFDDIDEVEFGPADQLEVRFGVRSSSEANGMFAFGTAQHPAFLQLPDDD